jgi:hypothetical protein
MSEDKRDIQAQLDRLELEWLKGRERYMVNPPFMKGHYIYGNALKILPVKDFRLWFWLCYPFAAAISGLGLYFSVLLLLDSGIGDAFPVILFFLFGVTWLAWTRHVDVSWKRARHRYKQALEVYMAERSELLGKLNGNDEQTGA